MIRKGIKIDIWELDQSDEVIAVSKVMTNPNEIKTTARFRTEQQSHIRQVSSGVGRVVFN